MSDDDDVCSTYKITRQELEGLFQYTLIDAASIMGVSTTLLKKKCRNFGIRRWPHRSIKAAKEFDPELSQELENFFLTHPNMRYSDLMPYKHNKNCIIVVTPELRHYVRQRIGELTGKLEPGTAVKPVSVKRIRNNTRKRSAKRKCIEHAPPDLKPEKYSVKRNTVSTNVSKFLPPTECKSYDEIFAKHFGDRY